MGRQITIGVLALQGAFSEHVQLLRNAIHQLGQRGVAKDAEWSVIEVRTPAELARCDALVLPGGESTTMSLVAERSGLLEPLRDFVKAHRRPTWGTCAGLILLSESANRTKKGGQELIGGLDVRVSRNHFGRQTESFTAALDLPFLRNGPDAAAPFHSVFIRAPVVERLLAHKDGEQAEEKARNDTIVAPAKTPKDEVARNYSDAEVEVLARLPGRAKALDSGATASEEGEKGDIIAVRQGNVFGTSFHPELTGDARIHVWWLEQVLAALDRRKDIPAR
ncbi:pyridoxine [Phyllosticta citrichinensis]|uniref:glutaminase n=1 Tax=Phyllosticta citrichinensis TaxID=1130410 RepID=A0ABR1XIG3_9PEZI